MTSQKSKNNRRKDPRFDNNIPVKISHEDGEVVSETLNISRSGAYCRVDRYIEPMSKWQVNLLIPLRKNGKNVTKKVCCEGVVVRTEPVPGDKYYNIAIFFNDISQRDAENITDYVTSCLE